jgi:hypothetical protein
MVDGTTKSRTERFRPYYLSPPQIHTLREACTPINEAFDATCYLVGSVLTRPDFRDVDVRLILDDREFVRFFGTEMDQHHGRATALWTSIAVTYSRDIARQTNLNIDFQIQARSVANDSSGRHDGSRIALFLPDPLTVTPCDGDPA